MRYPQINAVCIHFKRISWVRTIWTPWEYNEMTRKWTGATFRCQVDQLLTPICNLFSKICSIRPSQHREWFSNIILSQYSRSQDCNRMPGSRTSGTVCKPQRETILRPATFCPLRIQTQFSSISMREVIKRLFTRLLLSHWACWQWHNHYSYREKTGAETRPISAPTRFLILNINARYE